MLGLEPVEGADTERSVKVRPLETENDTTITTVPIDETVVYRDCAYINRSMP